jgi:DNA-binding XRE family transcriptional regulator
MNRFEEARINAGITVTELSREANISRSTIDKMEKDEPVKAELAVRACNSESASRLRSYIPEPRY